MAGFIEVDTTGKFVGHGWIAEEAVAPHAWLVWQGSKMYACAKPMMICPEKHRTVPIDEKQQVKVVGRVGSYWKLAGGAGYVPEQKKLEGPLSKTEALENQKELENFLSVETEGVVDSKALSKFNQVWSSNAAQHSKLALGVGLFVGGIFTHGLLWIAASAFGLATASTDIGVTVAMTEMLLGNVGYVVLALAQFERKLFERNLFSSGTEEFACWDRNDSVRSCRDGWVCVKHGVFFQKIPNEMGVCVRAPQTLMPLGEACTVDTDCASAFCKMNSTGSIADRLLGVCSLHHS